MNLLLQSRVQNGAKEKKRRNSIGKYIVIDSECDQEVIIRNRVDGKENGKEWGYRDFRRVSYSLELNKHPRKEEDEVKKAQKLLGELQRQCLLLERTISEMIEQEAELMVNLRRKQRSRSHQKAENSREKYCPVHFTHRAHQKDSMSNVIELKLSLLSGQSQYLSQRNQEKMHVETLHHNQIKFKPHLQMTVPPHSLLGIDDKHLKTCQNSKLRRM